MQKQFQTLEQLHQLSKETETKIKSLKEKIYEEIREDAPRYFRGLTPEMRRKWKYQYEECLRMEDDPGYMPKTPRVPWMIPHWQLGLQILEEVMKEKNELVCAN